MSAFASRIVTLMKADGIVNFYTAGRVYPHDIRQSGSAEANSAYDVATGFLQPTICVVDGPGTHSRLAPSGTYTDTLDIWIMADRLPTGSVTVDELATRVTTLLHRWQDTTTKALLTYAGRLGQQYDPDGSGIIDRVSFTKTGFFMGVRS